MAKILIISSCVHKDLSAKQLEHCLSLIKDKGYEYQVERLNAGAYEIPFVINTYQQKNPFDAYIALGLILKNDKDHYNYIMSHVSSCFTRFALDNLIVGNGIISGETLEELTNKIDSPNPCLSAYPSAFNAVDSLIQLKNKLFSI